MKPSTHLHCSLNRLFTLCILPILSLAVGAPSLAQTTRIIFLHHSCGESLINQGGVREGLTARGYEFYDHGYNTEGLRLADGSYAGTNFNVPGDNTDPDGFAAIFAQPLHDPPDNTFSHLMQYDVIAFKSCFPVSNIDSDAQLAEYQSYYYSIRDRMDQYPNKIFSIVTQPPQVPANSDPAEATRARAFVNWLQSDEYLVGHSNVFVFDFFGLLAGVDNFLRPEYRVDEYDAHPNERANRTIGPLFVEFIGQTIRGAHAGGPRPTSVAPTPPSAAATLIPPTVAPASSLIEDFESGVEHWENDVDESGSTVERSADTQTAHGGEASLRIRYNIVPGGWGGCGRSFKSPQNWSDGAGISLWLHSDGTGQWATLTVFAGDPAAPTPFETHFETTTKSATGWVQFAFPWTDFTRAEWADARGVPELDPVRVTGYGFSFGADNTRNEGILWVDDVSLAAGGTQPPAAATPLPSPMSTTVPGATVSTSAPATGEPFCGLCPFLHDSIAVAGHSGCSAGAQAIVGRGREPRDVLACGAW